MKKILIVSTVSRQFYLFEKGNIEILKSLGYEVHAAANFSDTNKRLESVDIVKHHFDIERSPFSIKNLIAYKQLKKIMETENIDTVHCHSPMGGLLARIAAKSLKIKKIIYTAHGFHFYKGASLFNWIAYYPIEKIMSNFTDILITINLEDYNRAKSFHSKKVVYVPGIGVDSVSIRKKKINRESIRKKLNISEDTTVLLSVGELIKRKNYETALKAIEKVNSGEKILYIICGTGKLEKDLKELTFKLGIQEKVMFLGFRNDIAEICAASDIFLFPSFQEGLPVSVMEAMSIGLPIICSEIRGNIDLIQNNEGGLLFNPNDSKELTEKIQQILVDKNHMLKMGENNLKNIAKYDINKIKQDMKFVYESI
ncbi:glycosyltransferase family 4 protein [Exiguobacterium mexicanum]|uniref:Glycosyltransferase family 4 protein n=1 Tax=Exiguobacterium mexicanum TaxID=340146 RepID=A0ABT7MMC7_9BACL|nr:glycosyltransferase family 4 protein [Exiguobacterium mexicanum]MDL5376350.1 glycosyltransferase family 4 protein [Exiguobacterium mexicanum]